MKGLITILLLFSFATAVNAQRKTWYGTPVATIPFTMYHSGVMVIKAKYENQADSLRFILDTGSGGASLDSTTCVIHGIKTEPSDITVSGIGARRKVHFVYNKTLDFPGITMERFNFHVNNYEVLTGVYGEKIDGIIGYQLFQRYTVFIDFDDGVIHLYEPGTFKKRRFRGKKLQTRINAIPSLDLEIEDNKTLSTPVYFDTGATTQRPLPVMRSVMDYVTRNNGNPHRGAHIFAMSASEAGAASARRRSVAWI